MNELFPETGKGSARIVVASPQDKTLDDYKLQIETLVGDSSKVDGVKQVVDPFKNPTAMSSDKKTAYLQVQLTNNSGDIAQSTIDQLNTAIGSSRTNGLSVESGGDITSSEPKSMIGKGEMVGVVVAFGVLFMTFFSLVAAGMPLLIALLGVGVSMAGLFSLSQVVDINSTTPALAVMLGLAVGIDYSLFIISSYRSYLLSGMGYRQAVVRAVQVAGSAVVFAAVTVIVALSALTVVQIPFITTMGLTAAATVAMAAITSIVLLPALLRLAGPRIVGRKQRQQIKTSTDGPTTIHHTIDKSKIWYRWGAFTSRHPIVSIVIPIVLIVTIALPIQSIIMGLPSDQYAPTTSTQRKAYDAISQGFGEGYNAPLVVVVEGMKPVTEQQKIAFKSELIADYQQKLAAKQAEAKQQYQQRFTEAKSPADISQIQQEMQNAQAQQAAKEGEATKLIDAQVASYSKRLNLKAIGDKIAEESDVKTVISTLITADETSGVLQVIPDSAPYDEATKSLIATLRDKSKQGSWTQNGEILRVTGSTALQTDVNSKLAAAVPSYLAVIVGLSLVLLIVAFRSLVVPIKATLGYLLSVSAMFGALVAVFQWGWFGITDSPGPIVSFIPIIGTGILFGLAMDYEFFIVSNMREEYSRTNNAKQSVINGFSRGSKVVVAAAAIMISIFAGFISNDNSTVQALGFALAVGVLVDAVLVRMIIVPAIMTLVGKHAWWLPAWLDKRLPHTPIEHE
jgi:RND superfamily putative drug exporter